MQAIQHRLHVGQVIHHVREDDAIELLVAVKTHGIGFEKFQVGMAFAGQVHRGRAEINADAAAGFDRGEQVAEAAADFEHALAGRDEKGEILLQQPVITASRRAWTQRSLLVVERAAVGHFARW